MKIAIIGSGISGIYAAHYLDKQHHEVTLYESNRFLGGHTDTHQIMLDGNNYAVDTGFIVFNEHNYQQFCRFLNDLNIKSQPSDMTFSVSNTLSGLEYNATTLDKLFCQRNNLVSPKFYRLILDIIRFYREAPKLLNSQDNQLSLGKYLSKNHYSDIFIEDHILPMACALWSGPPDLLKQFPARYLVAFMNNHQMLKIDNRPEWRTIVGGSDSYIRAFLQFFQGHVRLNSPVQSVQRNTDSVTVKTALDESQYDRIILCCHSDQALALLSDPSEQETDILAAIKYQANETVLHTDPNLMPRHPKAWASWNALRLTKEQSRCTVTYYMNLLQNILAPKPLLVTLNCTDLIDPEHILLKRLYHHPEYTSASLDAQQRHGEINGQNNTYYAGAYWGWGFHEDGAQSAEDVVKLIGKTQ